ncbi:hypothetical protein ACTXT7_007550 [Hymenolepis weldensis]
MPQKSLLSFFSSKPDEKSSSSPPPKKEKIKRRVFLKSNEDSKSPIKFKTSPKAGDTASTSLRQSLNDIGNSEGVLFAKEEVKVESSSDESQSSKPKEPIPKKVEKEPTPPPVKKRKTLQPVRIKSNSPIPQESSRDSKSSVSENPSKDLTVSYSKIDDFDPSKDSYNPIKDACWGLNEPVPYIAFAKTLERIEGISSRLKIIEVLSNFYRSVGVLSPKELPNCINMSINRLGPSYEGLELGIGESLLIKALTLTTGASNDRIKLELNRLGDLGAVAEAVKSRQQTMFKPKSLTLQVVYDRLKEIAFMVGNASQTKKVKLIQTLLVACRKCEAKYLIRSLQGKLRIGLAEQSVLAALGQAVAMTPFHSVRTLLASGNFPELDFLDASSGMKSESWKAHCDEIVGRVKQAYAQCPNYEVIVQSLLEDGPDNVHKRCCIKPGIPLRPMLAHPTHGVFEVLKRFDQANFTCEYKYDGERAQIHLLPDGSVRVYSRNQEDNTSKYPDIVNSLVASVVESAKLSSNARKILTSIVNEDNAKSPLKEESEENEPITAFIIDSEAVAWDVDAQQILPFQVLSTRKRKDVQEEDVKVRVCIYAFDLLYLNGVSLTEQPLRMRRELLRTVFPTLPGKFVFATSLDSSDTDEIARFMDESIKGKSHCPLFAFPPPAN